MSAEQPISVVIPMRDEQDTILELLARLHQQSLRPAEVVVVDAGSTDEGPARVRARFGDAVKLIAVGPALPGAARNRGIAAARHAMIALVDAGCLPEPGWLAELAARAATGPRPALVAGRYDPVIGSEWEAAQALCLVSPLDARRLRGPSTASLLLERPLWKELGGFREDLRAAEDLSFFRAAAARAIPFLAAPEARVVWRLPQSVAACWRRLRLYSYYHARSGLAHEWHVRVMAMDAALATLLAASAAWPPAAAVAGALVLARLLRTVWLRRANVSDGAFRLGRLARVALLLALADGAVWDGGLRAVLGMRPGGARGG
jgi:glycosyltransferase involved in cell wall biosynthesis